MKSLRPQKAPISADRTMYTERSPLRLPMDLRQWFPEDTLVAWIKEAIDSPDKHDPELKEALERGLPEGGKTVLSVIVLACITQALSSEDIAQACRSDKVFKDLCGSETLFPEELEQFRRNHRAVLELALTAVLLRAVRERFSSLEKLPPGVEFAVKGRAVDRLDTVRNMDTPEE